jgi:hypothetical protein
VQQLPPAGLTEIGRFELLTGVELHTAGSRLSRAPDNVPHIGREACGRHGNPKSLHFERRSNTEMVSLDDIESTGPIPLLATTA